MTFTENKIAETIENPAPNKYNAFRSFTDMKPMTGTEVKHLMFPRVSARKVSKSPSSADYEVEPAEKKTKIKKPQYSFPKNKRNSSFDVHAKKNIAPGVGTYKKFETSFNFISTSPSMIRKRI